MRTFCPELLLVDFLLLLVDFLLLLVDFLLLLVDFLLLLVDFLFFLKRCAITLRLPLMYLLLLKSGFAPAL